MSGASMWLDANAGAASAAASTAATPRCRTVIFFFISVFLSLLGMGFVVVLCLIFHSRRIQLPRVKKPTWQGQGMASLPLNEVVVFRKEAEMPLVWSFSQTNVARSVDSPLWP